MCQNLFMTKVSKTSHRAFQIFDFIGETSFCWSFAISSMIRQSLNLFLIELKFKQQISVEFKQKIKNALTLLNENDFHKRLRNEIVMVPIPKIRFHEHLIQKFKTSQNYKDELQRQQGHLLEKAIDRVCDLE